MPASVDQWIHESEASLRRSRRRRAEPTPHLMPRGWEWLGVLILAAFAAVGLALYVLLWAVI
jgi:hypothetical protein